MVKDTSSMQSLREIMADISLFASQREARSGSQDTSTHGTHPLPPSLPVDSDPPLERLGSRSTVQLRGHDAFTKSLMNRLATGQATENDKVAFNDLIQDAMKGDIAVKGHQPGPQQHPPVPVETSSAAINWLRSPAPTSGQVPSAPQTRSSKFEAAQLLSALPQMRTAKAAERAVPRQHEQGPRRLQQATRSNAAKYTKPFCDFLTETPTVYHAVAFMKKQLLDAGFRELSERDKWPVVPSGSYFVERNGSALIAFTVGGKYKAGNGAAVIAGHIDSLTARLKPIAQVPNKAGYVQLGVAPYAGAMNSTWWDRDLGVGGRVLVKEGDKIVTRLVKLDWPIARIPTLAPHFGAASSGPFNLETQMVPIIGLEGTEASTSRSTDVDGFSQPPLLGGAHRPVSCFVDSQPPALVNAINDALGIGLHDERVIANWDLELFDIQPATVGGLNKEFIFAGRIDDKLCSWAALQALIESKDSETEDSSLIKMVGLFDDEEIGSLLRQGAGGNFLPITLERIVESVGHKPSVGLMGRTYANSFLVSADVTHAVNPNFLNAYLENHSPHLNVGVVVAGDSNGHMSTDAVSTAVLSRCADKVGAQLQSFQIRNDSRSGGTVGPMLSSATGIRAIDAGLPQLSMHSIRATTGALDPGLGVIMYAGFLNTFEEVDREFQT